MCAVVLIFSSELYYVDIYNKGIRSCMRMIFRESEIYSDLKILKNVKSYKGVFLLRHIDPRIAYLMLCSSNRFKKRMSMQVQERPCRCLLAIKVGSF